MKKVYFLEKEVLIPYKKEEHVEKIGKFIGFSIPGLEEEKIFVAACSFVHHDQMIESVHKKIPETINRELFCAGNASSGNILRDLIFFSHDAVPEMFIPGLTEGYYTPLKNWNESIKAFGLCVVSSIK